MLRAILLTLAMTATSLASVNLEWRPAFQTVEIGETVEIGLYAVYVPDDEYGPSIACMAVLLQWDPDLLELLGCVDDGPYLWLWSDFVRDPWDLNKTFEDGDAVYVAFSQLGPWAAAHATPQGLLVTTIQFRARAPGAAMVTIPAELVAGPPGIPPPRTLVYSSEWPLTELQGELGWAGVTIHPPWRWEDRQPIRSYERKELGKWGYDPCRWNWQTQTRSSPNYIGTISGSRDTDSRLVSPKMGCSWGWRSAGVLSPRRPTSDMCLKSYGFVPMARETPVADSMQHVRGSPPCSATRKYRRSSWSTKSAQVSKPPVGHLKASPAEVLGIAPVGDGIAAPPSALNSDGLSDYLHPHDKSRPLRTGRGLGRPQLSAMTAAEQPRPSPSSQPAVPR